MTTTLEALNPFSLMMEPERVLHTMEVLALALRGEW